MKVCTVVGTRPEIIKLSRVMAALDKAVQHTVIHTGQNYDRELNQVFFEEMGIRHPDFQFETNGSIPQMMDSLQHWLPVIKPDCILILGDTNSCFVAAYVAARLKIPIFHLEAGNRCFDFSTPEELNRVIIDHIPGMQLCYSERSRENLVHEGVPTKKIIKVGSPMNEVLDFYVDQIQTSNALITLGLHYKEYFVVSCHREENVQYHFYEFVELLNRLAEYGQRILVTCHPRMRKRLDEDGTSHALEGGPRIHPLVEFHKPFGFFSYIKLQKNARCTLSDSGTISEESSILGFPALMLRTSHERPECDEEGGVVMVDFDIDRVYDSLEVAQRQICTPDAYCSLQVSEKVVKIILSHQ